MLWNQRPIVLLIVGCGVVSCLGAMNEAEAGSTVRMNPYRTSDNITPEDLPPIGYRYANLGDHERQSLRQSFKLPMEALAVANSINDLRSAAIVQPLPSTNQPFLPVSVATDATGDPFADGNGDSTDNALGALGRLFAKEKALRGAEVSGSSPAEYPLPAVGAVAADNEPLGSEDPFADDSASSEPEPESEPADPFGPEEGEDFDDDPFGDF